MSLAALIQAALLPTVAGGVFYGINSLEVNEQIVFPYIVWIKISSSTNNTLAGPTDMQNTRVQVDVFADAVSALDPATAAINAAMAAAPFQSVQLTSQDAYEGEVRAFRRSLDFSVWSTS